VKNRQYTERAFEELLRELRSYVGATEIDLQYVDEIPLVRTGKRSPVVSTLGEDFQTLASAHDGGAENP
jgi:hypothetical protein